MRSPSFFWYALAPLWPLFMLAIGLLAVWAAGALS